LLETPKFKVRSAARVIRGDAGRNQIADVFVQVEPQLAIKVAIQSLPPKPRYDTKHQQPTRWF
jgi:hypothetical protein